MNILVIIADCLKINSSANLCHLSYIKGLLDDGHNVTLVSASEDGHIIDNALAIPNEIEQYYYSSISLYDKLSNFKKKKNNINKSNTIQNHKIDTQSRRQFFLRKIKDFIRSLYGPYETTFSFYKKAKRFESKENFDFVISLAYPPISHLLAYKLLKKKNIIADNWIQIWEDPWCSDIYGYSHNKRVFKEEKKLLKYAKKVCYVSPITFATQQKQFPESAHKMFWQPLPCYYNETCAANKNTVNNYGYFGDYAPIARNLRPFYDAAKALDINVNICGNPSNLFESTDKITIYPRLPLDKLKLIEDSTNILIFLCNLKGGQIPGKIYQYSATTKTILFIVDGTPEEQKILTDYFKQFNRYVFCQNTVEDIKRAILDIENGKIGDIINKPIDYFQPKATIQRILNFEQQSI